MRFSKIFITFLVLLLIPSLPEAIAAEMANDSFILDLNSPYQDIQNTSKDKKIDQIYLEDKNSIDGNGFIAELSYPREKKKMPLTLSVSSTLINFGEIKPGEPLIRTHVLNMQPGSTPSYQLLASEKHILTSSRGNQIGNTSCDSGNCTQYVADLWTNPLTYGFGFKCSSSKDSVCNSEQSDFYQRFANDAAEELSTPIASSLSPQYEKVVISYKINIPGTQPQEGYQTTIEYLLVPNL